MTKPSGEGESFFSRFHRLKTEAREQPSSEPPSTEQTPAVVTESIEVEPSKPLTDEDMPPLETLTPESDYTAFMSPKVSDALRKAALRKLFHGEEFNVVDGLDEYAEDYTKFEPLGSIITADMRHQMEEAAKRKAEEVKEQLLESETEDSETLQEAEEIAKEPSNSQEESKL